MPKALLDGPVLEGIEEDEKRSFFGRLRFLVAESRTRLFQEGEPGDRLWVLLSGTVTLTRETEGGEVVELDRARTGDVFGELAVISPASRFATATTVGGCQLVVLERAAFRALIKQRDPAAEALLRFLTHRICRRLRQVDARIALVHDALNGASDASLRRRAADLDAFGEY
ncbi:MAG TPA: cyclic nucleotide-binding domain-containing protein [Myxococcota bacterium]|nr:cyclic nucleotide-binding domain-containing protein [Myxococcota bacterium]